MMTEKKMDKEIAISAGDDNFETTKYYKKS